MKPCTSTPLQYHVTAEGARRYGVVIASDGNVDNEATKKLRKELTAKRGEPDLFNFGGTIDEIKSRCLEETHLPAPESPSFN